MASRIGPLFVKLVAAPASPPTQKALALVTEDGEFVGDQVSTIVECGAGELTTITVKFIVDGDAIRFAANLD